MAYSRERLAGVLFLIAATQFIFGLIISEALYPGYSISRNYISDLGVGPSSAVFNSSVFLLGLLLAVGAYFLSHIEEFKVAKRLLFLTAVGAMGVGIFTENFVIPHVVAATMAFLFGGLAAIVSAKSLKKPLSLIGIVLGAMTLGAFGLFSIASIMSGPIISKGASASIFYLGLGPGGMERMIVYPGLMWLAWFSGRLASQSEKYLDPKFDLISNP